LSEHPIPGYIGNSSHFPFAPSEIAAAAEATVKQREAIERINDDLLQTFTTPAGKRVWEWLWKQTVLNGKWPLHLGADKAMLVGASREGQNALIMGLLERMEESRTRGTTKARK
jgi:hypothetical protein